MNPSDIVPQLPFLVFPLFFFSPHPRRRCYLHLSHSLTEQSLVTFFQKSESFIFAEPIYPLSKALVGLKLQVQSIFDTLVHIYEKLPRTYNERQDDSLQPHSRCLPRPCGPSGPQSTRLWLRSTQWLWSLQQSDRAAYRYPSSSPIGSSSVRR